MTVDLEQPRLSPTQTHPIRLDALHLGRQVGQTQLLQNISLSILPQEFVAIVGPSGAGKTTLLNALCGLRPATQGRVFINGQDLYQNLAAYRSTLGYVPQEDIIHRELTVNQALNYAARLRLPARFSAEARQTRIEQVLADLDLSHRRQAPIHTLSGGERKRVSIGVELLTQPGLFFLDEATSGLDPGMETQMMGLLRRLADQGHTVVLITHATKNVMQCDRVAFLTQGGRLAYWGPPAAALTYFKVTDFDQIYLRVDRDRNPDVTPEQWHHRYLASDLYQREVLEQQQMMNQLPVPVQTASISGWRQWWILTQRNLTILRRDRASLILMLLVAPILGIADLAVWSRDLFDVTDGNPADAFTMLFVMVLVAVLVGSLAMMREIVREVDIYRRERMIGLKILPYVASKVCLGVVLALYQAAIFLGMKLISVHFPIDQDAAVGMFVTLFLVTLAGMIMGLLVSACSPNANVAPLLTILVIVPQITFSGVLVPLDSLGPVGHAVSKVTITRWGHESMVTLSGIGRDIAADSCWQMSEANRDALTEADKQQCNCMGPNLFTQCQFPGLGHEYHPAVDQPEPQQPEEPGPVPDLDPFKDDIEAELDKYGDRVETYTQEMETWQDDYGQWKGDRGRAIAAGEALIRRYTEAEGQGYAVHLPGHWGRLGLVAGGMLGLITLMQKRKDYS